MMSLERLINPAHGAERPVWMLLGHSTTRRFGLDPRRATIRQDQIVLSAASPMTDSGRERCCHNCGKRCRGTADQR